MQVCRYVGMQVCLRLEIPAASRHVRALTLQRPSQLAHSLTKLVLVEPVVGDVDLPDERSDALLPDAAELHDEAHL